MLQLAACRLGFDLEPEPADAPPGPDARTELICGAPERFMIGAAGVRTMAAAPTAAGYALFTVDSEKNLTGWSYEWTATGLARKVENKNLGGNAGPSLGVIPLGTELLVASLVGDPGSATRLQRLSADLTEISTVDVGECGGIVPIARHGSKDEIAVITIDAASQVNAQAVTGTLLAPPVAVVPATEQPIFVAIHGSSTGYAVSWVSAATAPNQLRLARLDDAFQVVGTPVSAKVTNDAIVPSVAWAPGPDRYLMTWFEKTNADRVYFQQFKGDLTPLTPDAILLSDDSVDPTVVTDGTDFFVTWKKLLPEAHLEAARVAPDGTLTPVAIEDSGGKPNAWAMLQRDGQPVLVWAETGGNGPDLWLEPLCGQTP